MEPEEKIYHVLNSIDKERKISPDSRLVEFEFNDHVVGFDVVIGSEERKIILKLEREGVIKVHYPEIRSEIYRINENDIFERDSVGIEILNKFEAELKKYKKLSSEKNDYWKLSNPVFWIYWAFLWLFEFFKKHKIVGSIFGSVSFLLVYDYSLAWKNIGFIVSVISKFFKR